MSHLVCGGAAMKCSFGSATASYLVLPVHRVMANMPLANIMDNKPMVNIPPFGNCSSIMNPAVAAATAAAMGALTPQPCVPFTLTPWTPGSKKVSIDNMPALHKDCKLPCMWGGIIEITDPGQNKIQEN